MGDRLKNKRILLTQATDYMGPAVARLFSAEGAILVQSEGSLSSANEVEDVVTEAGDVDVLVANLALKSKQSQIETLSDEMWHAYFNTLVHPLMKLVRAVTPRMKARNAGKIVVITSAAPIRGYGRLPNLSAYCAARGAQNAFVRAVGLELAEFNIQVNAIAQNYVKNPTFYPDELIETEDFQQHINEVVPSKRIGEDWETAELALFLASEKSNFMVGQVIPFAGGWATTTG